MQILKCSHDDTRTPGVGGDLFQHPLPHGLWGIPSFCTVLAPVCFLSTFFLFLVKSFSVLYFAVYCYYHLW